MNEQEIAVKLEGHDHEIASLKYRMKDVEAETKAINDLTISVSKMAVSMENMLGELRSQGDRLQVLEKVPAETNKMIRQAIITTLGGGMIGAVLTKVLTLF